MPRQKNEPPAVRVYTVCDESRYLIVRNVPALGCGDELLKLFTSYGEVEECKPMDAEDCDQFTDVYWIKFHLDTNARFAKRKLDEFVFLGNKLQVSYAPQFESIHETKGKLEGRRREVLVRLNPAKSKGLAVQKPKALSDTSSVATTSWTNPAPVNMNSNGRQSRELGDKPHPNSSQITRISSNEDYFPSQSMNQTVLFVREKLHKIQSSNEHLQPSSAPKKARVDNRRRI